MSLLSELRDKLAATAAVTSLVPSERIKQEHMPQGLAFPFITMTIPFAEHGHDHGGSAGYVDTSVQVNVWARKITDRDAVAEQVRLALQGYSGLLTTLRTQGIILADDSTFYESDTTGGQNGVFHRLMEFTVMGAETIPA